MPWLDELMDRPDTLNVVLLSVTDDVIDYKYQPRFRLMAGTWTKNDIFAITITGDRKTSLARMAGIGLTAGVAAGVVGGALFKRQDVMITITTKDGLTASWTWKKANPAEIAQALQVRGWPVEVA